MQFNSYGKYCVKSSDLARMDFRRRAKPGFTGKKIRAVVRRSQKFLFYFYVTTFFHFKSSLSSAV